MSVVLPLPVPPMTPTVSPGAAEKTDALQARRARAAVGEADILKGDGRGPGGGHQLRRGGSAIVVAVFSSSLTRMPLATARVIVMTRSAARSRLVKSG